MAVNPHNDAFTYTDARGNARSAPPNILPQRLLSGGGIAGTNPRIRVDVGEPSFFDGRQFRIFHPFDIAASATSVIEVVSPVDAILYGLSLELVSGEIKVESVTGGTPGGTFSEVLPIFPRNTMSERPTPIYIPQITMATGGTHTGGTVLDLLWAKTAANSNFASSIGNNVGDERGVAAGTYYFRLIAVSAATGVFKARWEERLA